MITPADTERLAFQIVRSITEFDEELSIAAKREALADFAGMHDLDLDQTATLYAIAAHPTVKDRP